MKKYFILKLGSYEGEGSSLTVDADGADSMYVVLSVEGSSAEIVDWGGIPRSLRYGQCDV